MGCGSSSSKSNVSPTSDTAAVHRTPPTPQRVKKGFATNPEPLEPVKSAPRPPPLTFEVPIERHNSGGSSNGYSNNSENITRQHPPKRLLRLEEQQVPLTHQLLDDKLAEADLRRQKILNQRIQSATARKHRRKPVKADADWKISGAEDQHGNFTEVNPSVIAYM